MDRSIKITEETIIQQLNDIIKNPDEIINKLEGLDEAEISFKLMENNVLMILWYVEPNVISLKSESAAILLALYNLFNAIQFFNKNEKQMSKVYSAVYLKLKEYAEKNNYNVFPLITQQFIKHHKK